MNKKRMIMMALIAMALLLLTSNCRQLETTGRFPAIETIPTGDIQDIQTTTQFYAVESCNEGVELWKTDGTKSGTVMVKDINSGKEGSSPSDFTIGYDRATKKNVTYFSADNGVSGRELWKTDGTEAWTVMVKDINSGKEGSSPSGFTIGYHQASKIDVIYFSADDGVSGKELWKTDGKEAGTVMVKDINSGKEGSSPSDFTIGYDRATKKNVTYFSADNGVSGRELWKTDGTEAGTVMVKDINSGKEGSSPCGFTIGYDHGLEEVGPSPPVNLRILNKHENIELRKTNVTEAGTVIDVIYFSADDGVSGRELWKTDGTKSGTVMVKDINSGKEGSSPSDFTIGYDRATKKNVTYFSADNGVSGRELWKTDGTEAWTVMVRDSRRAPSEGFALHPSNLIALNGIVLFTAGGLEPSNSDPHWKYTGVELWKTDGTESGTVMVKYFNSGKGRSSPSDFTIGHHQPLERKEIYFSAENRVSGRELWKTDGTKGGTVMVKDIRPGKGGSSPSDFTIGYNKAAKIDVIYFSADNGVSGRELWKTDGTEAGTFMISNTNMPRCRVVRFAPLLLFDKAAASFPMSAQDYYDKIIKTGLYETDHEIEQNTDPSTLSTGEIPTYYRVFRCGNKEQVRIEYWWFYGYQKSGGSDSPEILGGFHNGDWEHIMVILNEEKSRINATTYFAHSGWSTWLHSQHEGDPNHMYYDELGGEHPIVYVGKNAHGSYHTSGGMGDSTYWGDWRNPGSWNKKLETWKNLIDLDSDDRLPGIEDWRDRDRQGDFRWGGMHCIKFYDAPTGVYLKERCEKACGTHPTTDRDVCSLRACSSRKVITATGIEGAIDEVIGGAIDEVIGGAIDEVIGKEIGLEQGIIGLEQAGGCGGWLDFYAGNQYGKRSDCMVYRQGSYWTIMPWGYDNTCYYNAKVSCGLFDCHIVDSYWIDYILPTSDYASGDDLGVRIYGKEPFYWWK